MTEIDKAFFRGDYETSSLERLLAELDGRDRSVVIGELEEATWNEARVLTIDKVKSPSSVYIYKLMDALGFQLNRVLSCDTHIPIEITITKMIPYIEILGYEIYGGKSWISFLETYTNYRKMVALITKIKSLDIEAHNHSDALKDIKALKRRDLLDKYSLRNKDVDALGLTLSSEFMPARMRDAVAAAWVLKSYVEENLSEDYTGCQVYVENKNLALCVVLRGECGSNPVDTVDDVMKLTK